MSNVKKVTEELDHEPANSSPLRDEDRLSLGTTMLNVAVSRGRWTDGGICKGRCVWYVGESESGKSFAGAQLLAEAANNPAFDDYELIYDDAENGLEIDVGHFYGSKLADRIQIIGSIYVEEFYNLLYKKIKAGKKFVYVLDSMDVLDTKPDRIKYEKTMAAEAKKTARPDDEEGEEKVAGSFGTSKAKLNKDNYKRLVSMIEESGCVLMIISQVYDAIGSRVKMKITAGGNALRFFSHVQLWTRIREKIMKEMGGEQWERGAVVEVAVRKNRVSGWHGKVLVNFLSNYGFDDTGSSVDFLVKYDVWELKKGGVLDTGKFGVSGRRENVIAKIEESRKLRAELRELVRKTFLRIDAEVTVERKPRYS